MSIAPASPSPTPLEIFGQDAQRAVRLYDAAVTSVLEQCKDRLRRGVAPTSVTVLLRGQYLHRLAPLAAGVEVVQDAVLDPATDETTLDRLENHRRATNLLGEQTTGPVGAGTVRYSPFGNAAPRPISRKKATA